MLNALWTVIRAHTLALFTDGNPHHKQCQTRATPPGPCNCNGRGARMSGFDLPRCEGCGEVIAHSSRDHLRCFD